MIIVNNNNSQIDIFLPIVKYIDIDKAQGNSFIYSIKVFVINIIVASFTVWGSVNKNKGRGGRIFCLRVMTHVLFLFAAFRVLWPFLG